ncbi:MAG: GDP-mannose 4,6-dehydratase [Candidatus Ratteibacteria bacterium]|nr:GDP-mannose 4,6-dehydratase [Candidatus Ratteibacteria bacterium]
MKCLVTGAAGFIGSHLIERLLCENSNQVWAVDDFSTGNKGNISNLLNNPRFHFQQGSILDKGLMEELIDECEVVYHLAAAVGVKYIMENLIKSIKINIEGTENVLEITSKGKKKVLITSSSEIYGKSENYPFNEQSDRILGPPTKLRWSYSSSKAIDEFLAIAYYKERGLPVVITRLFNVSGPRQVGVYGMVIPRFVKQALRGEPITVHGDGKQLRSFIHVEDAVGGLISLMENKNTNGEIFNLGSPQPVTISKLAEIVKRLTQSTSNIVYIPYLQVYSDGFEDLKYRVPDISKISKTIGFKPKKSLEDIIKDVIEYYR